MLETDRNIYALQITEKTPEKAVDLLWRYGAACC
jgi:hypothetical protein